MTLSEFALLMSTYLAMEAVAWLAHRYIMHGWFWYLHQDHHRKNPSSFLEKNDFFFVVFAIPGIAAFAIGTWTTLQWLLWVGAGVTLYGLTYFLIHDVFIHRRLPFFKNTDNAYLRAVRRAHKMHHKHLDKHDGECFGMLLFPLKYFLQELKQKHGRA